MDPGGMPKGQQPGEQPGLCSCAAARMDNPRNVWEITDDLFGG